MGNPNARAPKPRNQEVVILKARAAARAETEAQKAASGGVVPFPHAGLIPVTNENLRPQFATSSKDASNPKTLKQTAVCEACDNTGHITEKCFLTNPTELKNFLRNHPDQKEHWEIRVRKYNARILKREDISCGICHSYGHRDENCFLDNPTALGAFLALYSGDEALRKFWEAKVKRYNERTARKAATRKKQAQVICNPKTCNICGSEKHKERDCRRAVYDMNGNVTAAPLWSSI